MKKTKFSDLEKGKVYFNKNFVDGFYKFVDIRNDYEIEIAEFIVCEFSESLCEFIETKEVVYKTAVDIVDFIL